MGSRPRALMLTFRALSLVPCDAGVVSPAAFRARDVRHRLRAQPLKVLQDAGRVGTSHGGESVHQELERLIVSELQRGCPNGASFATALTQLLSGASIAAVPNVRDIIASAAAYPSKRPQDRAQWLRGISRLLPVNIEYESAQPQNAWPLHHPQSLRLPESQREVAFDVHRRRYNLHPRRPPSQEPAAAPPPPAVPDPAALPEPEAVALQSDARLSAAISHRRAALSVAERSAQLPSHLGSEPPIGHGASPRAATAAARPRESSVISESSRTPAPAAAATAVSRASPSAASLRGANGLAARLPSAATPGVRARKPPGPRALVADVQARHRAASPLGWSLTAGAPGGPRAPSGAAGVPPRVASAHAATATPRVVRQAGWSNSSAQSRAAAEPVHAHREALRRAASAGVSRNAAGAAPPRLAAVVQLPLFAQPNTRDPRPPVRVIRSPLRLPTPRTSTRPTPRDAAPPARAVLTPEPRPSAASPPAASSSSPSAQISSTSSPLTVDPSSAASPPRTDVGMTGALGDASGSAARATDAISAAPSSAPPPALAASAAIDRSGTAAPSRAPASVVIAPFAAETSEIALSKSGVVSRSSAPADAAQSGVDGGADAQRAFPPAGTQAVGPRSKGASGAALTAWHDEEHHLTPGRPWLAGMLVTQSHPQHSRLDTIASTAMRGRHLVRVAVPSAAAPQGVALYKLPSLTPGELEYVRGVERRLAAARYDEATHMPVFWDTETTGWRSNAFWKSCCIVQVGAVVGGGAPGASGVPPPPRELLVEANPYPVEMSEGAAATTGLRDAAVHAFPVHPTVGLAKFFDFVLDASARNGGALPLLVAHNAVTFDNKVLVAACWRAGLDVPSSWRAADTLQMADAIDKACGGDHFQGLKLVNLARFLGVPANPARLHNALEDSRVLYAVAQSLRREYGELGDVLRWAESAPLSFDTVKAQIVSSNRNGKAPKQARPPAACAESAPRPAPRTRATRKKYQTSSGAAEGGSLDAPAPAAAQIDSVDADDSDMSGQSEDVEGTVDDDDEGDGDEDAAEAWELDAAAKDGSFFASDLSVIQARARDDNERVRGLAARAAGVLDREVLVTDDVLRHWHPFTAALDQAGVPRKELNATMLKKLQDAGFETLLDLLKHIPRLEDSAHPSIRMDSTEKTQVNGTVLKVRKVVAGFKCSSVGFEVLASMLAEDGTVVSKQFPAMFFSGGGYKGGYHVQKRADLLRAVAATGDELVLVGRFRLDKRERGYVFMVTDMNVVQPRAPGDGADAEEEVSTKRPVYPSRKSVKEPDFRRVLPIVLKHLRSVHATLPPPSPSDGDDARLDPLDPLPAAVVRRYDLMPWLDALEIMHAELGREVAAAERVAARRRLAFQELLLLQLMLLNKRVAQQATASAAPVVCTARGLVDAATRALPFELTAAQQRCLGEILDDMAAPFPMLRLLQGDVGSGKTAVALLAAFAAIDSGYQVAMLVPNEVLAQQHFRFVTAFLEQLGDAVTRPRVEMVVGGTRVKERRLLRERLADGSVDLLIGTTALNNDEEVFKRLGLVIIDEQHRFGVRQRALLSKKEGAAGGDVPPPHTLHMTATPIPRTISMTLWGHMSTSALDELPPGRLPVKTKIVKLRPGAHIGSDDPARLKILAEISDELSRGGSVFWVFPLVEESEHFEGMGSAQETFVQVLTRKDELAANAVVLTGRMTGEEKALALDAFRAGAKRLLISTVVIEVGVDVPDATLMVVEHAERLGVLQLHQLRGRVGRSSKQSACSLLTTGSLGFERLRVLEESNNGFVVAKADMLARGAGQLLGQKQSGPAELGLDGLLAVADLCVDEATMLEARECAADMIKDGLRALPPSVIAALEAYRMTHLLKFAMQDVDMHVK